MTAAPLHEFMAKNRAEISAACTHKVKRQSLERSDDELAADFDFLIDEVVRALQEPPDCARALPCPVKATPRRGTVGNDNASATPSTRVLWIRPQLTREGMCVRRTPTFGRVRALTSIRGDAVAIVSASPAAQHAVCQGT